MNDIDRIIEEAWPKSALAETLPYESWERLAGESGAAYAAFCAFRDLGLERNIRKAVESVLKSGEKDGAVRAKRYRVWRNWSTKFRWQERAVDYDRYTEKLKQTEIRKTIEAQGEMHRAVTGKMLAVVSKKLDLMDASELTQGAVTEWVQTAIKSEREAEFPTSRNSTLKQGELTFTSDFEGL